MSISENRSCFNESVLYEKGIDGSISKFFRRYPERNISFVRHGKFLILSREMYAAYKEYMGGIRTEDTLFRWMLVHQPDYNKVINKERLSLLDWYKQSNPSEKELETYLKKHNFSNEEMDKLIEYVKRKTGQVVKNAVLKVFSKQ